MSTSLGSEGGGGGWEEEATEGQFPDDEPPFKRSRKRTKQVRRPCDVRPWLPGCLAARPRKERAGPLDAMPQCMCPRT